MSEIVRQIVYSINLALTGRYGHVETNEILRDYRIAILNEYIPGFEEDRKNARIDRENVFGDLSKAMELHKLEHPEVYSE